MPKLDVSAICPWQHFMVIDKKIPLHQNSHCFRAKNFMLVEPVLRNHLRQIVADMGLDISTHTFYTFSRSLVQNLDDSLHSTKITGT